MQDGFAFLRLYKVALVVGPQRSGTTFAANVIAADLKRRYVDEQDAKGAPALHVDQLLKLAEPVVVQCPAWTYCCHRLASSRTAVVLIRRSLEEILASQERIGWTQRCEPGELARYGVSQGPIAEVKYRFWDQHQRAALGRHGYEVEYDSLKAHPMWVDKNLRRSFGAKQIRPGEGNLGPQGLDGPISATGEGEGQ